jgi:hypothetical protein
MQTSPEAARTILGPILAAVERHPREIQWILLGLITVEDRQPNTERFWFLWQLFTARVRQAKWCAHLDEESPIGGEVISAIFLGSQWKETVRHWRSLEGQAHHVHALFEELPASSIVLDDYICFLHHIGEQSLPEAFVRIAKRLQIGDFRRMLSKANTVFLLEVLLQRYVYGKPLALKLKPELHEAVLVLLDLLVEMGSSAAFRMRDDFVTPASVN